MITEEIGFDRTKKKDALLLVMSVSYPKIRVILLDACAVKDTNLLSKKNEVFR